MILQSDCDFMLSETRSQYRALRQLQHHRIMGKQASNHHSPAEFIFNSNIVVDLIARSAPRALEVAFLKDPIFRDLGKATSKARGEDLAIESTKL